MFKKLTLISVFFSLLITQVSAFEIDEVNGFLEKIISEKVHEKFSQKVNKDINASSWIVEHEEVVYVLCAVKIQKDEDSFMQNSLRYAALRNSSIKAASNLALYLDEGKTNSKNFENKNAFNHVLRVHYESNLKFNSATKIIGDTAFSLVWANKVRVPVDEKDFNRDYCEYLYQQAQNYFLSEKFPEALKTFQQIHYMSWSSIDSYLGAALCFLRMNQKDDAEKLTSELISVLSKDMTPDEFFSAGQILFHSGNKDKGFQILEHAYKMLKSK